MTRADVAAMMAQRHPAGGPNEAALSEIEKQSSLRSMAFGRKIRDGEPLGMIGAGSVLAGINGFRPRATAKPTPRMVTSADLQALTLEDLARYHPEILAEIDAKVKNSPEMLAYLNRFRGITSQNRSLGIDECEALARAGWNAEEVKSALKMGLSAADLIKYGPHGDITK